MLVDPRRTELALLRLELGDMESYWVQRGAGTGNLRPVARGRALPSAPLRFDAMKPGPPPHDVVFGGALAGVLTPRGLAAFEAAAITGWRSFPGLLVLNDGTELPVHLLAIHGRSGGFDFRDARRVELPPTRTGLQPPARVVGYGPDMSRWDGSELFLVGDTDCACMTRPAATRLAAQGLTGLRFTEVDSPMTELTVSQVGRSPRWSGD